jgi:peptidyl-tRNA hydrolase
MGALSSWKSPAVFGKRAAGRQEAGDETLGGQSGAKYAGNRHNIGFMVLTGRRRSALPRGGADIRAGDRGRFGRQGDPAKPETFMNRRANRAGLHGFLYKLSLPM